MMIQIEKTLVKTDIDFIMKRYSMNTAIWTDTYICFIVKNTVQSVINVQTSVNYVRSISHSMVISMDKRVDLVKCFLLNERSIKGPVGRRFNKQLISIICLEAFNGTSARSVSAQDG